jgi:hypothetical protein
MKFSFKAELWRWPGGTAAWHFVHVPKELSEKIKKKFGANARGWGSLPVSVTLGKSKWKTSIFPDKKSGTYLLPVKAGVRKAEGVYDKDMIKVTLQIELL